MCHSLNNRFRFSAVIFNTTLCIMIRSFKRAYVNLMCVILLIFKLSQVFDILNSAELICLMRRISIPKNFTVECMVAMNHNSKNASIWLGCGHTDKGQLSFLDLNTERYTSAVSPNTI